MADNHSVGSAYLSVSYKTDKGAEDSISKSLESAAKKGGAEGGKELGDELEKGISSKSVIIGNLIANAITAAASKAFDALGDMMAQAFEGFGRFEQLEGGVDILFGADAVRVMESAAAAWQTAGLSANDYMQNVTSFSAGLISSLGGDTAEAARVAEQAIIDMSDNANTFGTDMTRIQDAYSGLMRDNYTMLDNLSLGFAGTQQGMRDLLAEAERISGTHFEFGNLADEFEAIHVVQEAWGIMGKTADEAAHTVEGSLASLSAAWSNWLVELGKSDADIERVTGDLLAAFGNAAKNVVPLVGRIVGGMIRGLPQVVATAAAQLPSLLTSIFSALFGESVGEGIGEAFAGIGEALQPLGEAFGSVAQFAGKAVEAVRPLFDEVLPGLQPLLDVVETIAGVLVERVLPTIVSIAGSGIVAFVAGVAAAVAGLIGLVGELVAFVSSAPSTVIGFFTQFEADITGVFERAGSAIQAAFKSVVEWFGGIPDQIVGFFEGIGSRIAGLFSGIKLPQLHISGSFNPADWLQGNLPSISFYAEGGIADRATLGVFGEAGPEALVPLTKGRLRPFGESVAEAMGGAGTTNVYINGAKVNSDEAIEESFYNFMRQLSRLNQMGGVAVG